MKPDKHKIRKTALQRFFNIKNSKTQLSEMFGDNANIVVTNLNYVRSKKSTNVSLSLYIDDPEKIDDLYPFGVELLAERGWKYVGDGTPLIVQTSFDLNPTTRTSVPQVSGTTNGSL